MKNEMWDILDDDNILEEYDDIDMFQKFNKRPRFSKPKIRNPKEESVQNSRRRKEKERKELLEDSNKEYYD